MFACSHHSPVWGDGKSGTKDLITVQYGLVMASVGLGDLLHLHIQEPRPLPSRHVSLLYVLGVLSIQL